MTELGRTAVRAPTLPSATTTRSLFRRLRHRLVDGRQAGSRLVTALFGHRRGPATDGLTPTLRAVHHGDNDQSCPRLAEIRASGSPVARLLSRTMRLPCWDRQSHLHPALTRSFRRFEEEGIDPLLIAIKRELDRDPLRLHSYVEAVVDQFADRTVQVVIAVRKKLTGCAQRYAAVGKLMADHGFSERRA